jgi:hypothetical protein
VKGLFLACFWAFPVACSLPCCKTCYEAGPFGCSQDFPKIQAEPVKVTLPVFTLKTRKTWFPQELAYLAYCEK